MDNNAPAITTADPLKTAVVLPPVAVEGVVLPLPLGLGELGGEVVPGDDEVEGV